MYCIIMMAARYPPSEEQTVSKLHSGLGWVEGGPQMFLAPLVAPTSSSLPVPRSARATPKTRAKKPPTPAEVAGWCGQEDAYR